MVEALAFSDDDPTLVVGIIIGFPNVGKHICERTKVFGAVFTARALWACAAAPAAWRSSRPSAALRRFFSGEYRRSIAVARI
jgi:hypothetical protein